MGLAYPMPKSLSLQIYINTMYNQTSRTAHGVGLFGIGGIVSEICTGKWLLTKVNHTAEFRVIMLRPYDVKLMSYSRYCHPASHSPKSSVFNRRPYFASCRYASAIGMWRKKQIAPSPSGRPNYPGLAAVSQFDRAGDI